MGGYKEEAGPPAYQGAFEVTLIKVVNPSFVIGTVGRESGLQLFYSSCLKMLFLLPFPNISINGQLLGRENFQEE